MNLKEIRAREQARRYPNLNSTQTPPQVTEAEGQSLSEVEEPNPLSTQHSKLSTKLERFCQHYFEFHNAAAAARSIGCSEASCRVIGFRLLQRPDVQERLKEINHLSGDQHEYTSYYSRAEGLIEHAVALIKLDPRQANFNLKAAKLLMHLGDTYRKTYEKEEARMEKLKADEQKARKAQEKVELQQNQKQQRKERPGNQNQQDTNAQSIESQNVRQPSSEVISTHDVNKTTKMLTHPSPVPERSRKDFRSLSQDGSAEGSSEGIHYRLARPGAHHAPFTQGALNAQGA